MPMFCHVAAQISRFNTEMKEDEYLTHDQHCEAGAKEIQQLNPFGPDTAVGIEIAFMLLDAVQNALFYCSGLVAGAVISAEDL